MRQMTHLLQITVDILRELPEEHTEQACQQRTGQIKTLLPEMVTIIQFPSLESGKQKPVDHVPKEVCLLGLGALGHGDMR